MIDLDFRRAPEARSWRSDPCGVLYDLALRHPGAAATLKIGVEEILVLQDAEASRHVGYARADNYVKNFAGFRQFFGNSRLTKDGDDWRVSRGLSQPSIAGADTQYVALTAERIFGQTATSLLSASDEGTVQVDPFLDDAAGGVIAEVALGFEPHEVSPTLAGDFRLILQHASLTTWNLTGAVQVHAPEVLSAALDAKRRLVAGIADVVARRRSAGQMPQILNALLGAADSSIDIFAEVCGLLFAGFDTSSAALGWSLWLLAGSEELQSGLRSEIDQCFEGGRADLARLLRLPTLNAFLNESLRIFPPIPILSRIAVSHDQIGKVQVAAGQKVLLSVIGLHHDRLHFAQPRNVSLERFPGGEIPATLRGHFLPFGAGKRACPGSRIASTELAIGLAQLIHSLTFYRPENELLAFDWLASLRRKGGHRLEIAAAR